MYKFEFIFSDEDYLEFSVFHYESVSFLAKKTLLFLRWVPPAVNLLLILRRLPVENWFAFLFTSYIMAAIAVVYIVHARQISRFICELTVKIGMAATKKDGRLPYDKNVRLEFHEDYIYEVTERTETKINYASIERVIASPKAVYLYTSAIQALILPFTAFESEEQKAGLRDFINKRIPQN